MTDPIVQESYIVNEGKKRGSTRDVRPEAAHDRFYTVTRPAGECGCSTSNPQQERRSGCLKRSQT